MYPAGSNGRILLADQDPVALRQNGSALEAVGYSVIAAADAAAACRAADGAIFDVCFLDLNIAADGGITLLLKLRDVAPWMHIVVLSARGDIGNAVAALHAGAVDYLRKPCLPEQLLVCAEREIHSARQNARIRQLEDETDAFDAPGPRSANPAMRTLLALAKQVATTDASVLLLGESGTGKGMLARAIHRWSPRATAGFVTLNCPSLSAELMENELFGHQKGAYTGALERSEGRVVQAEGGTLFLDEVGDFPSALQPKLLRFIQDREYERVGDPVTRTADVRIIAATNRDLLAMVHDKSFRADLYYRLNVINLVLPPLRERSEDIARIAETLLARFARQYRRPARQFSTAALQQLQGYPWPGNIRELQNIVERAAIVCTGATVLPMHIGIGAPRTQVLAPRAGDRVSLQTLELAHISSVLRRGYSLAESAAILGIDVSTLYRRRREFAGL